MLEIEWVCEADAGQLAEAADELSEGKSAGSEPDQDLNEDRKTCRRRWLHRQQRLPQEMAK